MSDYEAALDWYEQLLGGPPTKIPTEGEAVWRLTDSASLYIVVDPERAGRGLVTLSVRDLDELGLTSDPVADPDGNSLRFFVDPG